MGFPVTALQSVAYADEIQAQTEAQQALIGNGFAQLKDVQDKDDAPFVAQVEVTADGQTSPTVLYVNGRDGFQFSASGILNAMYPDDGLAPNTVNAPVVTWEGAEVKSGLSDWNLRLPLENNDSAEAGTVAIGTVNADTGAIIGVKNFKVSVKKKFLNIAKIATMSLKLGDSDMPRRGDQEGPYYTTYTGNKIEPTPVVTIENETLNQNRYTVTQGNDILDNTNVQLDDNGAVIYAGIVIVTVKDNDEKYYGEKSINFQIDQCEIDIIEWTTDGSTVYNGSEQGPTATGTNSQNQAPSVELVGLDSQGGRPTDVGNNFTFYPSLNGNNNYKLSNDIKQSQKTFSITPAPVTILGGTFEKVYDGSTDITNATTIKLDDVTLDGIVDADVGKVVFAGLNDSLKQSISFADRNAGEGKDMKTTAEQTSLNGLLKNEQDADKAKNYNVVADDNGALFAGAGTITAKELQVTGIAAQDKVYDATKTAYFKGGQLDNGEEIAQEDQGKVKLADELKGEFETANVGSGITVTLNSTQNLTGEAASNYTPVLPEGQSLTANITQAPLTITAKDQTIWQGGSIATGSSQYSAGDKQLKGEDKLESVTLTSSSTAQPTKEGKIVASGAKVAGAEGSNATGNYNIKYVDGVLTVNEKQVQTITASDVTATYGDEGKAVVAKSDAEDSKLSYAVKDGGAYVDVDAETGALTIKAAGKATVTVSATETEDHKPATKDVAVTVAKADSAPAEVTANDRTWDGTEQPLVNVSGEATGGKMLYSADGYSFFSEVPAEAKAGKYTVWYKVAGDANHNDTKAASVPVTIAKADSVPAEVTANDREWDGTEQPLVNVSGEAVGGEMLYSADGASFSAEVPAATEAGKYTVWYKVAGDANHNDTKAASVPVTITPQPEKEALKLTGAGHVQRDGDAAAKAEGAGILIGTTGESKRLEQFSVALPEGTDGSIEYRGHVQGTGWVDWSKDGAPCGTTGESKRVEAVQMQLSGKVADDYSVWYRVHSQTFGWLGWARDGQAAGTAGQSKRAEAVEVQVLPKGQTPADYVVGQASYVGAASGEAHVQGIGWASPSTPLEFGTTGQSRRLEAVRLSVPNQPAAGGISYEVHAQGIGWMPAATDGELAGTEGQSRRLEAVRASLTGDMAGSFSVWYRVHSQSFGWLGWAHDGAEAGTTGLSKRAEAIEVQVLPKGQVPDGYDAGQATCVTEQ